MVNPILAFDCVYKRTSAYHRLQESLQAIHTLMEKVIDERAKYLNSLQSTMKCYINDSKINDTFQKRRVLLDTLLLAKINGESLNMREIRDEVNTFVLAVGGLVFNDKELY